MPKVGEKRPDGKVWAGDQYGWQSPNTVWKQQKPGSTKGETRTLPGLGTKVWAGTDFGWQTQAAIDKNKPGAKPAPKPAKPEKPKDSRLDSPIAGPGPKGNQVGSRPSAPPPPPTGGSGTGAGSRRPPSSPTPSRQPAPESPAVREYMKAAAAARKSGDTAQMAKVRDTGLDIWRKKYAGTLAKNVNPDGTQKGTGQSVMAKQAAELRALRPAATETGPQAQSALPGGAYSPAATSKMTQRTRNILGVKEQYDAYDLVLEYLLSNGHVDTLDEAHYVMMQMDGEYIQSILEDCK